MRSPDVQSSGSEHCREPADACAAPTLFPGPLSPLLPCGWGGDRCYLPAWDPEQFFLLGGWHCPQEGHHHCVLFWQKAGVNLQLLFKALGQTDTKEGTGGTGVATQLSSGLGRHWPCPFLTRVGGCQARSPVLFHRLWFLFGSGQEELWLWRPCAVDKQGQVTSVRGSRG